jgi:hypothetical protein
LVAFGFGASAATLSASSLKPAALRIEIALAAADLRHALGFDEADDFMEIDLNSSARSKK